MQEDFKGKLEVLRPKLSHVAHLLTAPTSAEDSCFFPRGAECCVNSSDKESNKETTESQKECEDDIGHNLQE